jgi:hypothetical protein
MPPNGYTGVTISDEAAEKLVEVMVRHDLDSMAMAIEYAADAALDEEPLANVQLAQLLHHRLQAE